MAEKFNFPSKENNVEIMNFLNNSSKYLESNDMRVTEVYEGYAKVEMIIDENILNAHGFVHGGALFSLADTCAGSAAYASGRPCVTLNGHINYIRPALGEKIIGIAQEISQGKTTGVYEVFVFNNEEKLLCRGTFTLFYLDSKEGYKKQSA